MNSSPLDATSLLMATFFVFLCMRFIAIPSFNLYLYFCIAFLKESDSIYFVICYLLFIFFAQRILLALIMYLKSGLSLCFVSCFFA